MVRRRAGFATFPSDAPTDTGPDAPTDTGPDTATDPGSASPRRSAPRRRDTPRRRGQLHRRVDRPSPALRGPGRGATACHQCTRAFRLLRNRGAPGPRGPDQRAPRAGGGRRGGAGRLRPCHRQRLDLRRDLDQSRHGAPRCRARHHRRRTVLTADRSGPERRPRRRARLVDRVWSGRRSGDHRPPSGCDRP